MKSQASKVATTGPKFHQFADPKAPSSLVLDVYEGVPIVLSRPRLSITVCGSPRVTHGLVPSPAHHGRSLFGSSLEDVLHAFHSHFSPTRFGELAGRFFGDFLAKTLRFFVETELSNNVDAGHERTGIMESSQFTSALDIYTRESAKIVEEFDAGWYSKHNWKSGGAKSQEEVQGLVVVALRKLRMELRRSEP